MKPSRMDAARATLITGVLLLWGLLAMPPHPLRRALLQPFRPLRQLTGTGQSWAMFALPDRNPRRLEIHVDGDAGWTLVFRKNDPEHDLAVLHDRRVRALYDTTPDEGSSIYWTFTRWIGREVLAQHPEAKRVRVRLVQTHTTDPWEPLDPTETIVLERIHSRLALFADDL